MEKETKCPYCGSTHLALHQRGFSANRAILGKMATGSFGWGAVAGSIGSNDLMYTCLDCNKTFNIKSAQKDWSYEDKQAMQEFDKHVIKEKQETTFYICDCGKEFFDTNSPAICPRCGRYMTDKNIQPPKEVEKQSLWWVWLILIVVVITIFLLIIL